MEDLEGDGKKDMDLFYSVKSAANYMDINPLLEMICLWLAFKIAKLKKKEPVRIFILIFIFKTCSHDVSQITVAYIILIRSVIICDYLE
jgi:hypothetical protein